MDTCFHKQEQNRKEICFHKQEWIRKGHVSISKSITTNAAVKKWYCHGWFLPQFWYILLICNKLKFFPDQQATHIFTAEVNEITLMTTTLICYSMQDEQHIKLLHEPQVKFHCRIDLHQSPGLDLVWLWQKNGYQFQSVSQ